MSQSDPMHSDTRRRSAPSYDRAISGLFSLLTLVLLTTLALAIVLYGEPFLFWHHAFSDLGNTVTRGGHPNGTARLVFSAGMIVSAVIMLRISSRYAGGDDLRHHVVKRRLAFLGAVGLVIAIYPNDVNHTIHSVGVGMVIGALYLFVMIFHLELRPRVSLRLFLVDLAIVQVAVFAYAGAFFAGSDSKQSLQKMCVVGLCFGLERIVTATEESFRLREVVEALQGFQN